MRSNLAINYKDLTQEFSLKRRLRSLLRDTAVFFRSIPSRIDCSKEWIRFPFYHHVFDDERKDFKRHLKYLKNYGDFISLDTAINILEDNTSIGGNYFCITFDDGFKNCLTNALPILVENQCPAAFFVSTDYIGCSVDKEQDVFQRFFSTNIAPYPRPIEFLNWDDCKTLIENGMIIGSHTCSHRRLSNINSEEIISELKTSKKKIEEKLGINCTHFATPWGIPGKHYHTSNDTGIAKELGYRSFLTTERGANYRGADPFRIKRDTVIANWGNYQLRYFFSK